VERSITPFLLSADRSQGGISRMFDKLLIAWVYQKMSAASQTKKGGMDGDLSMPGGQ
jgi:hypothetical protein